jgi:hypothetical protein
MFGINSSDFMMMEPYDHIPCINILDLSHLLEPWGFKLNSIKEVEGTTVKVIVFQDKDSDRFYTVIAGRPHLNNWELYLYEFKNPERLETLDYMKFFMNFDNLSSLYMMLVLLRLSDHDDLLLRLMVSYSCHNFVLSSDNFHWLFDSYDHVSRIQDVPPAL